MHFIRDFQNNRKINKMEMVVCICNNLNVVLLPIRCIEHIKKLNQHNIYQHFYHSGFYF